MSVSCRHCIAGIRKGAVALSTPLFCALSGTCSRTCVCGVGGTTAVHRGVKVRGLRVSFRHAPDASGMGTSRGYVCVDSLRGD